MLRQYIKEVDKIMSTTKAHYRNELSTNLAVIGITPGERLYLGLDFAQANKLQEYIDTRNFNEASRLMPNKDEIKGLIHSTNQVYCKLMSLSDTWREACRFHREPSDLGWEEISKSLNAVIKAGEDQIDEAFKEALAMNR